MSETIEESPLCSDVDEWYGCYKKSSRDDFLFTARSVKHPAKMALGLTRRILDEMTARGWIAPGSTVIDPFGGRGTTAAVWCSMHPENRAVTVECEKHFVKMQRQNRQLAFRRLGRPLLWKILRGDSRRVDGLLAALGAGAAALSPPYGEGVISKSGISAEELIRRCPSLQGRDPNGAWFAALAEGYVNASSANIDRLKDTPPACATSPPYENSVDQGKGANDAAARARRKAAAGVDMTKAANRGGPNSMLNQPQTYQVAATSPPWENSLASDDPDKRGGFFKTDPKRRNDRTMTSTYHAAATSPPWEGQSGGSGEASRAVTPDPGVIDRCGYRTDALGKHSAQIGMKQNESYADACGAVYAALARAGVRYIAIVTKNPTRQGKLRRLDLLTADLLRQAGYRIVAHRRAWLFHTEEQREDLAGQQALFGEDVTPSKRVHGRISFFKRDQIRKGLVAAAWEDVLFAELDEGGGAAVASPPYQDMAIAPQGADGGAWNAAYREGRDSEAFKAATRRAAKEAGYGKSAAQIGALKDKADAGAPP